MQTGRVFSEAAPSAMLGECWWLIRSELQCQAVPRLAEHPLGLPYGGASVEASKPREATVCAAKVSI